MTSISLQILDILKTEFNDAQARKIAEVVDTAITDLKKDEAIATKLYVNEVEKNISDRLNSIDNRLTKIESTMATKDELLSMKFDMLKWIIILVTVNTVVIISAVLSIGKFLLGK